MCALQPKIAKRLTKTLYFEGSLPLKDIDVDTTKKLVISAWYDKQERLCLSATVFTLNKPVAVK